MSKTGSIDLRPLGLLSLTLLVTCIGCRLLERPNPQLPPEFQPPEGPRASTVNAAESADPPLAPPPAAAPTATPPATSTGAGSEAAAPTASRPPVALPAAPAPSEGKSGRLLIEPLVPMEPERELTPLPDDPEFRRALKEWDDGPIRYIILKEEQDLFRRLETDEDRLLFILDFWARRDRAQDTPENEYRQEFWRRVSEAERRFIDSPQPGWKTDRGRIWIVMGPPDQTEMFRGRREGRPVIRWVYRERPNLFLEPNFYVAFRQVHTGEYELSNDLRDFDPVFRDLQANMDPQNTNPSDPLSFVTADLGKVLSFDTTTRLALFLDLGQAVAPPELYRRMGKEEEKVETQEIFGALDVRTSFEFLGPLPEGRVRSGVVVGILKGSLISETDGDEADASITIDMSLYPGGEENANEEVIRLPDVFGASRENYIAPLTRRLVYRTELALLPGTYLAVYRILDRTTGQASQARETFSVTDRFQDDFTLSTIVLAHRLAPVDLQRERADAFTMGNYRVVPNIDATYRNGDELAFYYQVTGASLDPQSGRRRLDVRYHFAAQQGDDWLDLGESLVYRDLDNPQGWSAPLVNWPPASYRLTVTVVDQVSRATTSRNAFFRVLPGS